MEITLGTVLIILAGILLLGGWLALRALANTIRSFFSGLGGNRNVVIPSTGGGNNAPRETPVFLLVLGSLLSFIFLANFFNNYGASSSQYPDDMFDDLVRVSNQPQLTQEAHELPKLRITLKSSKTDRADLNDDLLKYVSHDRRAVQNSQEGALFSNNRQNLEREQSDSPVIWDENPGKRPKSFSPSGSDNTATFQPETREPKQYNNSKETTQRRNYQEYRQTLKEQTYYSVQVAAGSNPEYVYSDAQKFQKLFPRLEVLLYDDPHSDWIKILVGEYTSENESASYKKEIERRLKQKCQTVNYQDIDENFLFGVD